MAVIVAMFMPVGMIVGMAVCVPMIMQRIHALCQCLVLGKAGVMAVAVAAAIGTRLRLERRIHQGPPRAQTQQHVDRKSTPLNSSHSPISYAVFCLKKKKYWRAL